MTLDDACVYHSFDDDDEDDDDKRVGANPTTWFLSDVARVAHPRRTTNVGPHSALSEFSEAGRALLREGPKGFEWTGQGGEKDRWWERDGQDERWICLREGVGGGGGGGGGSPRPGPRWLAGLSWAELDWALGLGLGGWGGGG